MFFTVRVFSARADRAMGHARYRRWPSRSEISARMSGASCGKFRERRGSQYAGSRPGVLARISPKWVPTKIREHVIFEPIQDSTGMVGAPRAALHFVPFIGYGFRAHSGRRRVGYDGSCHAASLDRGQPRACALRRHACRKLRQEKRPDSPRTRQQVLFAVEAVFETPLLGSAGAGKRPPPNSLLPAPLAA